MNVSRLRSVLPRLLPALLLLALLAVLATGCIGDTDTPQNTLNPVGEVAKQQRDVFFYAMWPALVVMIFVEGAIVMMLIRFRRRKDDRIPRQIHGNTRLEIAWSILPAILILIPGAFMLPVLFEIGREPKADAFQVQAQGEQFQWTFAYPEILDGRGDPVTTLRGEAHIPAGREIALSITSIDVNHSFGVPRIAGTRDAVPGQTERMWIRVDTPGTYHGQCRELCGSGHATMLITMIVQNADDFQKWANEAKAGVKRADDIPQDAVSAGAEGK